MIKRYASFVTVNNLLKKHGFMAIKHSNHNINGRKQGFTGFFESPDTGKLCYISTDITCLPDTVMIRSAVNERDYTGGRNHYCSDETELVTLAKEVTA